MESVLSFSRMSYCLDQPCYLETLHPDKIVVPCRQAMPTYTPRKFAILHVMKSDMDTESRVIAKPSSSKLHWGGASAF